MGLDLKTKVTITKEVSRRYARASKKEKGRMLDEFCALTDYNRKYAGRVLGKASPAKKAKTSRGRPEPYRGQGRKPIYTADVRKALVKVW